MQGAGGNRREYTPLLGLCNRKAHILFWALHQRSPTFLAPGTDFVEDNFSTDGVGEGDGSGSNASDGERQMKLP